MNGTPGCGCGIGPSLVFAGSGAAGVGAVIDLAARGLPSEKQAFTCRTAAIATGIPELVEKARAARNRPTQ